MQLLDSGKANEAELDSLRREKESSSDQVKSLEEYVESFRNEVSSLEQQLEVSKHWSPPY